MSLSRSWFRFPFVHRSRAERRQSPALAAIHWDGSTPRQSPVSNISASGAYLLTNERWSRGEVVALTLQRSGALQDASQRHFTVHAKSIRWDKKGVGVSFVIPRGADPCLWQSSFKARVSQTEPEDVVREFRLASALAFIRRLAPEAMQEANLLFRDYLSNYRLESAIEIALHAQELLALDRDGLHLKADPTTVLRILYDGSWAETEWIQHYWAGVLATACSEGNLNRPHLNFVDLLSQLTTIQARIFRGCCERASKLAAGNGQVWARPLLCTAEELVQISDIHDRVHIERDIQQLVSLGLLEESIKWKFFAVIEEVTVTPTSLALELYARCHGHHGDAAKFFDCVPRSVEMAVSN